MVGSLIWKDAYYWVAEDCLQLDAHGVQSNAAEFNIKKRLFKQLAQLANIAPNKMKSAHNFWINVHHNLAPGMRTSDSMMQLQLLQIESPETRNVRSAVTRKVDAVQRRDSSVPDHHAAKASARRVLVNECCCVRKHVEWSRTRRFPARRTEICP